MFLSDVDILEMIYFSRQEIIFYQLFLRKNDTNIVYMSILFTPKNGSIIFFFPTPQQHSWNSTHVFLMNFPETTAGRKCF